MLPCLLVLQQMLAEAEQPGLASDSSKGSQAEAETRQASSQLQDAVSLTREAAEETETKVDPVLPKPRKTTTAENAFERTGADGVSTASKAVPRRRSNAKEKSKSSKRVSDLSMDQEYNAEMLDRFGSVDSKPTRDLKLDPVLQLVKWRESVFGSRDTLSESKDSISESLDETDE